MNFLSSLFERRTQTSGLERPEPWLVGALTADVSTIAGAKVNEASALGNATVFACVRLIAESIASLPFKVYRRIDAGGRVEERNHPLYVVLHDLFNPELTSYEARVAMTGHLLLWGNAFAEIDRGPRGEVRAIYPLRPDRMTIGRDELRRRVYVYQLPDGTFARWTWARPEVEPAPVLHIRGLGGDGYLGWSVLRVARNAIGAGLAADEYAARLFSQGARPSGVLRSPKTLTDDAARRMRESWELMHRGLSNAHRVAVLEEGTEWQAVGMNADDAELLQTRRFSVNEIARLFRVPPHLVGDVTNSTSWGSGLEQQDRGFIRYSLMPWLVAWEQAAARDLLSIRTYRSHYCKHVLEGFLRADLAARFQAYQTGIMNGIYAPDECRELEDLNPRADGLGGRDRRPANMVLADAPFAPGLPAPQPSAEPAGDGVVPGDRVM